MLPKPQSESGHSGALEHFVSGQVDAALLQDRKSMRFIPTIAHGLADYIVGLIVIAMPIYFAWTGSARIFFMTLGAVVICYSMLTDYELGLVKILRIRFHLLLDALFGIAMLAAPTLLNLPIGSRAIVHVIGGLSIFLSFTTKIRAHGTGSQAAV